MTTTELGYEGVTACISIGLLLFAYLYVYRKARLDDFRQDLFNLRNEIWDSAYERGCLETAAHREFREALNGFIRIAPGFNLFTVLPLTFVSRSLESPPSMRDLIAEVPDPVFQNRLRHGHLEMGRRLMKYLFLQTFPGCLVGWPVYLCLKVKRRFNKAADRPFIAHLMTRPSFLRAESKVRSVMQMEQHLPVGKI